METIKKNRVLIHILLFLLTAGIGNLILEYYIYENEQKIANREKLENYKESRKERNCQSFGKTWEDEPFRSIKQEAINIVPLINRAHRLTEIFGGIRITDDMFCFPTTRTQQKNGFIVVEYNDLTPTGRLPKYEFSAILFFGDVCSDVNTISLNMSFIDNDHLGKATSIMRRKGGMVITDFVIIFGKVDIARVVVSVKGRETEIYNYRKQPLS